MFKTKRIIHYQFIRNAWLLATGTERGKKYPLVYNKIEALFMIAAVPMCVELTRIA